MRRLALALTLAACSVPDKNPTASDAGMDAMLPVDDNAVPDTTITEAPADFSGVGSSTFKFNANFANTTFECSIDGESALPCSSPYTRVLPDGSHNFSVRAINKMGKGDDTPAEHLWMIDTVAPNTMLTEAPPPADNSVMVRFSFRSSEENVTFDCSLDGGGMADCASPFTLNNLPMGEHTFQVRVRDIVGNFDPTPSTRTWTVDLDPPETTIDTGPAGMVRVASASFTFSSNELDVTYRCSLDGAASVACTSPQNFANLGQGTHTFTVAATDAAAHTDPTPATRMWTVDTVAPDVMITGGPAEAATVGPRVGFTFSTDEGALDCAFDAGGFAPCAGAIATNLGDGGHAFRVTATDPAGNVTTLTRNFTVACAAPPATGAAGLLHLDDSGQTLANATGGAAAVLGTTDMAEVVDPALGAGRFGGGAAFSAVEGDRIGWPAALGATADVSVELYAKPDALAGSLLVSGDGSLAIRVAAATATTVRITASVTEAGGAVRTVQSAPVGAGAWHHVMVSSSAAGLRLWVDGVRTEVAAAASPALDTITLGASYSGVVDEVWVAQTAITDDNTALARFCP